MEQTIAEINVLIAKAKQLAQSKSGKQNETHKHAVAVLIAALHQAGLFVPCEYLYFRFISPGQVQICRGISGYVAFVYGVSQCSVKEQVDVGYGFGCQTFLRFEVIELLQQSGGYIAQEQIAQRGLQMHADLCFLACV